jgi:hypothetical protein
MKHIFPDVEVMSYEDESSLNLGIQVTPHIWLSDVEPARRLKLWGCEVIRQPLVVTRRLRQEVPAEYSYLLCQFTHSGCGGMTDATYIFHIYHTGKCDKIWETESVGGRDLNSIMDPKAHGYPCPPPRTVPDGTPTVIQLQSSTYHVSGFYPRNVIQLRFVVPSMFLTMGWDVSSIRCAKNFVRATILEGSSNAMQKKRFAW